MRDTDTFTVEIDGKPRRAVIEHEDPAVVELLRGKSRLQRAAMADRLIHDLRCMAESRIRREHPDWANHQVAAELIWRYHGVRV